VIGTGDSEELSYLINVDRLGPYYVSVINGTYYVQVTNLGDEATSDLHVVTTLQGLFNGTWETIEEVDVAYSTVLQPGETAIYEAPVQMAGDYSAYRAVTHTTIDNFVGHIGQRYGAVNYDGLETLGRDSAVVDGTAVLKELGLTLPDGYNAALLGDDLNETLNGSAVYDVTFEVANVNSTAGGLVLNDVTLELQSGVTKRASANASLGPSGPATAGMWLINYVNGNTTNGTFTFYLTVDGVPYTGDYYRQGVAVQAINGVIELQGAEGVQILDIPVGSHVQVTETGQPTDYDFESSEVNGAPSGQQADLVKTAQWDTVSFTNRYTGP